MKVLSKVLVTIFIALFSLINVKAISVDSNNITIDSGGNKSIDVYANVDTTITSIDFNLIYSTYDVVAKFSVNPAFTDSHAGGITHSITLGQHQGGKIKLGTINIDVVDNPTVSSGTVSITRAKTKNANQVISTLASQIINVNVNKKTTPPVIEPTDEKPEKVDYNLLKSIDSDIVNIKLEKDVFKYDVTITDDIEKLDLKPIAIDDSYKVDISSQKISELKNNKITIKVSNSELEKEYEIKVKVKTTDDEVIEEQPEKEVKPNAFKYKSKWIIIILLLGVVLALGVYLNKNKK